MKTLIKCFLLIALILSTSSCSKDQLRDDDHFTVEDALDMILNSSNQVRTYRISFSFKDIDGNDLAEPFAEEQWIRKGDSRWWGEINPDKYKLDFILPNPPDWWDNTIYNHKAATGFIPDVHRPYFVMYRFDDKGVMCENAHSAEENDNCSWYLYHDFGFDIAWFDLQKTVKYQITCPTIFGDNDIHEFITYWKEDEDLNPNAYERFATCTKVEYDGKVLTPKKGVTIKHYEFPDPYEDVDVTFVNYLVDIVVDR